MTSMSEVGTYTRLYGHIVFRPNLPGVADLVLEWVMDPSPPREQGPYPAWLPAEFRDGYKVSRDNLTSRGLSAHRIRGLLWWYSSTQYPHSEPRRTGRKLDFDFNLRNYEQEIQRFLIWARPLSESWNMGYHNEFHESSESVIMTPTGFRIGGDVFECVTTLNIMEASREDGR